MTDQAQQIVRPDGRPARDNGRCQNCGASRDKRVQSSGFGTPSWCCGECGADAEGGPE